ncbi:MAG: hypothetical protein A2Z11_04770 [Candidatus Woykebacteria bacterium RBG_16_43_9]|uniref:Mannosylglycerate hydrolase MGH1-like glycoside hydrolase domain-containing protein n=1 Tax=Candidatus Woykebacteria bacterium RBG_16_43_9 TaxID=1802596 RepID=A0A1G1WGX3_9BACT|nr:MAG: hypothetical protein A2Z11_04770 [Candidatus Woykebacteria bacterium RBG_16_43_9]
MKRAVPEIIESAKQVLWGNLKTGYSAWSGTNYKYICPANEHYTHQWFWDSCFHAIVLTHFDVELAKNEINSLLFAQKKEGFIPHIIHWDGHRYAASLSNLGLRLESKFSLFPSTSQLIQPPLIAQAVEAIYKKDKDIDFLRRVVPKLKSYYLWLSGYRDPDQDGLISIIAPYESGLDQSPSYDPVLGMGSGLPFISSLIGRTVTLRNLILNYDLKKIFEADYFNVEDVLVNAIYIKNLKVLSGLLHEIDHEEAARHFYHLSEKGKNALIKKCYDSKEAFFFDVYGADDKKVRVKTIKGLMPLILDLPKRIVADITKKHVFNKQEFDLPYPVPTVSASEESFSPTPAKIAKEPLIWRGPTWINTNWYLVKALHHHGYNKEAQLITEKSLELVKKSGFREFFNPFSGEGYGAHNFSWSTLVVDMILS